jgi:peptidoglycan/LPS O-acetylase OafA/YrhL
MSAAVEAEQAGSFRLGYRRWLDGLRGLAILAVVGSHLNLLRGGFLGVDLFFVLSGFLITALLLQEWQSRGAIDLKRFYLRRALRLWPGLFALLAVCLGVSIFLLAPEQGAALRHEIVIAGCYLANWNTLHMVPMATLGYTWSLAVEEQFYLIWPLALAGMLRWGVSRRQMILVVCAGIAASGAVRAALYDRHPASEWAAHKSFVRCYTGLDTRADALLVGCLVGLLAVWDLLPKSHHFQRGVKYAAPVGAAFLVHLFIWSHLAQHQLYNGLFTVIALLIGLILMRLLSARSGPALWFLESAPLVAVGRISYSLYLVHLPIILLFGPNELGLHTPGYTLLVTGLCLVAAVVCHWGVERPFLRLKDRMQAPPLGEVTINRAVAHRQAA